MKNYSRRFLLSLPVIALLGCVLPACASKTYQKADNTALSLRSAVELIEQTRSQLTRVSDSLALLQRPDELPAHYAAFVQQVAAFEKNANAVVETTATVQSQGDAYVAQWQQDLALIQNTDIRRSSNERLNQVTSGFGTVKTHYDETKNAFVPLLADLKDIQAALGSDLTAEGSRRIQPYIVKASANIEPVKRALENLASDFAILGASLQSGPAAAR